MATEAITAILPVWNRRDLIRKAMGTLQAQTSPPAEILVIDNGSTDGAAEEAEAAGARVVRMGRNAGFAAAMNQGIGMCRTEWVAAVNNDVQLAADYFETLLRAAREGNAWFATGRILSAERPHEIDGTFDVLCRGGCAWRFGNGEPDGPEFAKARAIYSAPWTAALFRAGLFVEVGLLEERFGSYLEDVDFGARCARSGRQGIYVPEARAWHQGSATLGPRSPAAVRLISRNQVLLAARHLTSGDLWNVLVAQALWGVVAVRHGAAAAWLSGKWEGLMQVREVRAAAPAGDPQRLRAWLRENEALVRRAPANYWRVYSLLTRGEAL